MKLRTAVQISALISVGVLFEYHDVRAAQSYTEIFSGLFGPSQIGPTPGSTNTVKFVNDNGAVAGSAILPGSADARAFVWTLTDGFTDVGTLGGPSANLVDFNNNRVAVGNSAAESGGPSRVFVWSIEDGIEDIGTLGGTSGVAADVNDNNWVVGRAASPDDEWERAFLWTPEDGMIDLCQTFACFSSSRFLSGATAANNTGLVVGYAFGGVFDINGDETYGAGVWDTSAGTFTYFFNELTNQHRGNYSTADMVTDSGWIAGRIWSGIDEQTADPFDHAVGFVRSPDGDIHFPVGGRSRVTDLSEGGWAVGIRDDGQGFVWSPDMAAPVDLGELLPGARLFLMTDGVAAGTAFDEITSRASAFIWNQQDGKVELTGNPEYNTLALGGAGGRIVGINFLFDPASGGFGGTSLFVWDGEFDSLTVPSVDFTGSGSLHSIEIGGNGFIAGTLDYDSHLGRTAFMKVWAPSNVFNFTGFFQPVDNAPTVNTAKAGSKVPVRFSLDGDRGLEVLAFGYPESSRIACTSAGEAPIEETVTVPLGEAALNYQTGADRYAFAWSTERSWSNTCRRLTFKFIDGTVTSAFFKFK